MKHARNRLSISRRTAFTLVELVVSLSVGAVISGLAGMLLWNATKQRTEVSARSELIDMGSSSLECMIRYIREISQDECPGGPSPCLNGNAQISEADATIVRFDSTGFRLNGNALQITNDDGINWHSFATDISGLVFTYFDKDSATLTPLPLSAANRNAVRRVSVQIDLARGSESTRVRSSIYLRNFMNEVTNAP